MKCSIGDILSLQRGYDLTKEEMKGGAIPVVGSNGIIGSHNVYNVKNPVITLGRSGTVGIPHIYEENCWVHNTALFVSDFKGNNPYYLYYLLQVININQVATSTGVPTLNRNFVYPLKIQFEGDLNKQNKIASLLYLIDRQIKRNNEMVQKLQSFKPAFNFSKNGGMRYAS